LAIDATGAKADGSTVPTTIARSYRVLLVDDRRDAILPLQKMLRLLGQRVAVTGYGQEEDRRRAAEAGFDFHVTKPVAKDRLEETLTRFPRFSTTANGLDS
jgi:CheY-like chemotaxis protein